MSVRDWDKGPTAPPPAVQPLPFVPRPELAALAGIADGDARLFLRFYLRSNIERDLDIARARCAQYGVDYETARAEARRT